jgi:hypothetical protein
MAIITNMILIMISIMWRCGLSIIMSGAKIVPTYGTREPFPCAAVPTALPDSRSTKKEAAPNTFAPEVTMPYFHRDGFAGW